MGGGLPGRISIPRLMETLFGPTVDDLLPPLENLIPESPQDLNVATLEPCASGSIVTLEPYRTGSLDKNSGLDKFILHVENVPLSWSFDIIYEKFSKFGVVKELRNRLGKNYECFETWVIFLTAQDAFKAQKEFTCDTVNVHCSLTDSYPLNLDLYRPPSKVEEPQQIPKTIRSPCPPRWLIITTCNERGNLFKVKRYVNQKLGDYKRPDVSRFDKNSF